MQSVTPVKTQILRLYRNYLRTAQSFSSYNFRTYFLRRSKDMFRTALLPSSQVTPSFPSSKQTPSHPISPSSSITETVLTDTQKLARFYQTAMQDLKVLQRSAIMNRIYEGDKLVVEKPRLIVAGGGAGVEASVGGGGQPISGSGNTPLSG